MEWLEKLLLVSFLVAVVAKNNLSQCENHGDCKSARRVPSVVNLNAITFKSADSFKQCSRNLRVIYLLLLLLLLPFPALLVATLVVVGKNRVIFMACIQSIL